MGDRRHLSGSSATRRCGRRSSSAFGTRPSGCRNMCRPRRSTDLPPLLSRQGPRPLRRRPSVRRLSEVHRPRAEAADRQAFNVKTDRANTVDHGLVDGRADLALRDRRISSGLRRRGMMSTHWPLYDPDGNRSATRIMRVVSRRSSAISRRHFRPADAQALFRPWQRDTRRRLCALPGADRRIGRSARLPAGRKLADPQLSGPKHNEISWASRVEIPLQFLLPSTSTR